GYIAEVGDVDRMAKYTLDLLTNKKKYDMFSTNARKCAVTKFDKSIVIPQYEEHYKKVLSQKS
ncbi:MAG: N-acetyl-alpha-D-glucosaminyl L-malate synthase BshA, partial [Ignavibacterium sp.]